MRGVIREREQRAAHQGGLSEMVALRSGQGCHLSEGTMDVRAVDKGAVDVPLTNGTYVLLPHMSPPTYVVTRKGRVKGSQA